MSKYKVNVEVQGDDEISTCHSTTEKPFGRTCDLLATISYSRAMAPNPCTIESNTMTDPTNPNGEYSKCILGLLLVMNIEKFRPFHCEPKQTSF